MNSKLFNKLKEGTQKVFSDTFKGYVLGSFVGMFVPTHRSLPASMHRTGTKFATVSGTFSLVEFTLENVRDKKDSLNSVISGGIAGGVGVTRCPIMGAVIFGGFSGITEYLTDNKNQ